MSEILPYRVQYSNGESICADCRKQIAENSVQLAVKQQSTTDDCVILIWYHQKCFFKFRRPVSETLIDGFVNLRYDNQIEIRTLLGINVNAPKKQANKRAAVSNVDVQMPIKDFSVQYSRNDVNSCEFCKAKINENVLCVMKICYDTVLTENFSSHASWYEMKCFIACRTKLGWLLSGEDLPGFKRLNEQDKEMVKKHLTANTDQPLPTKKTRIEIDSEADQAFQGMIKKQNKDYFELRDNIEKHVSQAERIALLKAHNQVIHDENDILDHLTDIFCFGALKECKDCNGQFVLKNLLYRCTGSVSAWANCSNKIKEPERTAVKIPIEFQKKYPFLEKTFKIRARILKNVTDLDDDEYMLHAMQPLFNMEFFVLGQTKQTHEEIEEKINTMGGKIASDIHSKLAAIISNVDELKKMGKEMVEAQAFGIQVVTEQILDDVKMSDPISLIIQNDLSAWGKNPKERLPKKLLKKSHAPMKFDVETTQNNIWTSGREVDPESKMGDITQVYQRAGLVYSAVLDFVDIIGNKNSYHKIQLLEQNSGDLYWVFESRGRIATSIGSTSLELYTDSKIAVNYFTNKYFELTGNVFGVKEFVKLPGKFNQIQIDDEMKNQGVKALIPSTLNEPVLKLMELLFDENMMRSALIGFGLDINKMPLGKISKREISNAVELLVKISSMLGNNNQDSNTILATSNQFYSKIPHNFGTRRPPIINTHELIQGKLEMLDAMSQMEIAYGFMTENSDKVKNPFDHYYDSLNTHIELLDKSSAEYDEIQMYVRNTEKFKEHWLYTIELQEVFKVCRNGEAEKFKPFERNHNRQLLWHGSQLSNFVGILSNGLKIRPAGVPGHGKCFGNGLYFADSVSKSARYCHAHKSNNIGLLLLCEVAVGNCDFRYHADSSKLPSGKNSVKCVGRNYPHPFHIRDDGLKVPNGLMHRSKHTSGMDFNEFIVYNESQAKMRYLVKVKFNQINKPNH